MDLKAVEALLAVATTGTVAAAARQLDMSRTSLRRRLDALEAEVGVALVHRGDSGARLTSAGRLLAARGEAIVQSVRAAAHDARVAGKKPKGAVRCIMPLGAPPDVRARATIALARMHPDLQFEYIETEEPLAHLEDEFDLLIHFGDRIDDGGFFVRSIARMQLCLMASQDYLDKHGAPETASDLEDHTLLLWRATPDASNALPLLNGTHHPVKAKLASANLAFIREVAAQGGGIAWGMPTPFGPVDAQRALVPVLPEVFGSTLNAWLVCPLPSTLDPRIRVMLEGILELVQLVDIG